MGSIQDIIDLRFKHGMDQALHLGAPNKVRERNAANVLGSPHTQASHHATKKSVRKLRKKETDIKSSSSSSSVHGECPSECEGNVVVDGDDAADPNTGTNNERLMSSCTVSESRGVATLPKADEVPRTPMKGGNDSENCARPQNHGEIREVKNSSSSSSSSSSSVHIECECEGNVIVDGDDAPNSNTGTNNGRLMSSCTLSESRGVRTTVPKDGKVPRTLPMEGDKDFEHFVRPQNHGEIREVKKSSSKRKSCSVESRFDEEAAAQTNPLCRSNKKQKLINTKPTAGDSESKETREFSTNSVKDEDGKSAAAGVRGFAGAAPDEHETRTVSWEERLGELQEFWKAYKHCRVPHNFSENPQLAHWTMTQRRMYELCTKGKPSTMTPDRITALEKLDFVWNRANAPWEERFEELLEFRQTYMHCNVPKGFSENPRLATWIRSQRRQYKEIMDGKACNFLTPDRVTALEKIGFRWNVFAAWEERLDDLQEFHKRYKHCNVPRDFREIPQLLMWTMTQRKTYKLYTKGKPSPMTPYRVTALEKIGFVWDLSASTWRKRLGELREFRKTHKHCNVPRDFSGIPQLAYWVNSQRLQYSRLLANDTKGGSSMTPDRVTALEELGFIWDITASTWEERLGELREFRKTHKHCNVPCDFSENPQLAYWVNSQRGQYKLLMNRIKGSSLTPNRVEALEDLGFVWN